MALRLPSVPIPTLRSRSTHKRESSRVAPAPQSRLRELEGEAYERTEVASWALLQERLTALQEERAALAAAG